MRTNTSTVYCSSLLSKGIWMEVRHPAIDMFSITTSVKFQELLRQDTLREKKNAIIIIIIFKSLENKLFYVGLRLQDFCILRVVNDSQNFASAVTLPSDMFPVWLRWQFPAIVQKNLCDLTGTWRVIPNTVYLRVYLGLPKSVR